MIRKFKLFFTRWDGQKIFNVVSGVVLVALIFFYSTRFLKLYFYNKDSSDGTIDSLVYKIQQNSSLVKHNTNYVFRGSNVANYLLYSNRLWRIVGITTDNNLRVVSNEAQAIMAFGDAENITKSNIFKWLNSDVFLNTFNDKDKYLVHSAVCKDIVDNINDAGNCNEVSTENYVSMLGIDDFVGSNVSDSYLVNGQYSYLANSKSDNTKWYINNEGKLAVSESDDLLGIRPVITINGSVSLISGDGSKDNPYIVEEDTNDVSFGDTVKLGDDYYYIYQVEDDIVRLIMKDIYKINDEDFENIYSSGDVSYDVQDTKSVAYYLNNTFYNKLSYKDNLVTCDWYYNEYGNNNDFDYQFNRNNKSSNKVGMYRIGNILIGSEVGDYFTMSTSSKTTKQIYVIKENGKVFIQDVSDKAKVRPAVCIAKSDLISGDGTSSNPWGVE
ncbi:MAG: hypothetical protein Q4G04_05820 [bacterium]|nr:hypothetical protein [bacterium]